MINFPLFFWLQSRERYQRIRAEPQQGNRRCKLGGWEGEWPLKPARRMNRSQLFESISGRGARVVSVICVQESRTGGWGREELGDYVRANWKTWAVSARPTVLMHAPFAFARDVMPMGPLRNYPHVAHFKSLLRHGFAVHYGASADVLIVPCILRRR